MIEEVIKNNLDTIEIIQKKFPQLLVDFCDFNERSSEIFTKVYTIKEKDDIVGCMILNIIYERMELIQIEIVKEKRNQGYAKKLLEYMIEEARNRNLENITLEVRKDNEVARHLYKKMKFQEVAIRKNYYHGIDGILMERKMMEE